MKKSLIITISALLVGTLLFALVSVNANYSDTDPLVTLSYINETVIPKITEDVKNAVLSILNQEKEEIPEVVEPAPEVSDPNKEITNPEPETSDPKPDVTNPEPEVVEPGIPPVVQEDLDKLKYSVVFLSKGQKLMATGKETSSLEVILRAGSVITISPFDDQGIADLTSSKELYNNDPLVKNNYCIIPRGSDGRGIATVDSDAYILVRGEYEIVQ